MRLKPPKSASLPSNIRSSSPQLTWWPSPALSPIYQCLSLALGCRKLRAAPDTASRKWNAHVPHPAGNAPANATWSAVSFYCSRAHCWLTFSLCPWGLTCPLLQICCLSYWPAGCTGSCSFIPGARPYICLWIPSVCCCPFSQHVELPAQSSPDLQHISHSFQSDTSEVFFNTCYH